MAGATTIRPAALAESVNDTSFVDIVRRHLELDPITGREADETFAHFARDMGENGMIVRKLDAEHGASQDGSDFPFEFDSFFGIHIFCKAGARFERAPARGIKSAYLPARTSSLRPLFPRARFVHGESASLHFLAVECGQSRVGFRRVIHGDKRKAAGAACGAIHHEGDVGDFAMLFEHILEIIFCRLEGEITYIQFHL